MITGAHDCSDGGLGVTLAECAIASGIGAKIEPATPLAPHEWLFAESAGRAIVATTDPAAVLEMAAHSGVPAQRIGLATGDALEIAGICAVPVVTCRSVFEEGLSQRMNLET